MAARNATSPMILAAMLAAAGGLPRLAPSASSLASPAVSAPASEQRQAPQPGVGAAPGAPPAAAAAAASSSPPPAAREIDGWSGPLRLYGEFFGKELTGDLTATGTQDAVARYLPAIPRSRTSSPSAWWRISATSSPSCAAT